MQARYYKGYSIWGHAILQPDGYAASGTITSGTKVVEASGILAHFSTELEAETMGLDWAKAWVDSRS
ncbi:hypothetical protein [Paraburkholderia solisilvae]|uniref:Transposase n=1 Tax=Paraburkholderia solisilvae TaxID=624376 RepID=A0A6J5E3D4_9BURK|nr:hypothetical protein [Paraburkholderia solisilvae]CAB3759572.1 hypothetical protein LMG29739_03188 [Paraburkholderia solisilvae]